jgi:SAM-dependent methyltransferase
VERPFDLNRAWWDERAPAHASSPDYARSRFAEDPAFISHVVRFDQPRLGDLRRLRGVHLQCHIGTDTISLARLGAEMTGLDFSPASLAEARKLAALSRTPVEFVQAEVYEAPEILGRGRFDLVYTGVGAICWLPSIAQWANVVSDLLKPGGRLFMREGHPMLWALDDERTDVLAVEYAYFEREEPMVFDGPGTYVQTSTVFQTNVTNSWNHGLGEIVSALLESDMELTMLVEHQSVPWDALPRQMQRDELGEWRLIDRPWRVPHTYTLQAIKRR